MKNDKKIEALMNRVKEGREKIGKKPRQTWLTNGLFRYDDDRYFNLNVINDTEKLVDGYAFLLEKNQRREEAARLLDVECGPFEWCGYSVDDWKRDFEMRISVIRWNEEDKKLKVIEKKLSGLLSEEARTANEIADLEKLLG